MNLQIHLKKIPYFSSIASIAKKKNVGVWLIGGFLRDVYLKKKKVLTDFDFCVEKNASSVASEFAKKISSKMIVLDQEQESFRVILKRKGKIYTYDFTLMRGKDFIQDLSLRDFSINTLALSLNADKYELIDPFCGVADCNRKVIRFIKEEVLLQDPLRILRGFSFMANYGFKIDSGTSKAMVKYKGFIKNVSGERVSEELFKIFLSDKSYSAIKKMSDLGIIDEIIPSIIPARGLYQGGYHHLDVWAHSLETLYQFEQLWDKEFSKDKSLGDYFRQELAVGRQRIQIVKLACLLHDIGKPAAKKKLHKKTIFHSHEKIGSDLAQDLAKRLKLSFREKEVLKKLIFWHLRPGYLADQLTPSRRAVYRFFRDTEDEGIGVIALSLSDWRATRGPLTNARKRRRHEKIMLSLVHQCSQESKKKPLIHIVDGYDIMKKFKIKPSPLIGKVLKKIREEQILGKVRNKTEAYKLADRIIKVNKGKKR